MYTLIVDCSNFALEHGIHIVDPTGETVGIMHLPTSELSNFIANDSRITSVKLAGITEYCNGIKEEIENKMATEYAKNIRKVEIEVI